MPFVMQILVSVIFPAVPLMTGVALIRLGQNWKWLEIALVGVGAVLYFGILMSFPVSGTVIGG